MKRKATYTVEVPIRFTFTDDAYLESNEVRANAQKELKQRLINGYFDILLKRLDVVDKVTHYTREEIMEQDRAWDELIGKSKITIKTFWGKRR